MPSNRKLGKPTDQRMAMLRGLVTDLLNYGQLKTTVTRAKEVQPLADKMVTLAKQNDWLLTVRLWLSSPRRTWPRSCLTRSAPSMLTATVVTPASSASGPAAVTPLRWPSSSWSDPSRILPS
mgnify:CR=1 FL=1